MTLRLFLAFSSFLLSSALAQRLPLALYKNQLSGFRSLEYTASRTSTDTLRVLALMVDFPFATGNGTTGNGGFQLQTNVSGLIDPPPHDSTYFAFKLRFIENYFRKVSNGQLVIKGDVLGRVITVSKTMPNYAPPNHNNTLRGLADLSVESWKAADSLIAGIPFSQYQAFVIFHAGVGHDIDVVGFLGFDPAPNDLPSIYLGLKSFQDAFQNPAFPGIQTRSGFKITNTLILPETETRVFTSGGRSDTLKLSINGLAAASIGSHLGLPDLFDTKSGRPGIGQFGLMDGASIFAYNGIFPPEPSAWEKVYLGWTTPLTITESANDIPAPAVGGTNPTGQDTIYKIPVSNVEYFLVENRNRDPEKNGQRITIYEKGAIRTEIYPKDTIGFSFDDVSLIHGSVIDVEDFDWALIGDMRSENQFHGGGILIWHIDERIIRNGLASNTVNADPKKRGVDLEEADGSEDIGEVYDILDPGAASTSGSPLDCWFDGNGSRVYRNAFDKTSYPNSNSNSGIQSLISIKSFSARNSRMTFSVAFGEVGVKPLSGLTRFMGSSDSPQFFDDAIFIGKGDSIFAFRTNGKSKVADTTGLFSSVGGRFPVAANFSAAATRHVVGVKDSTLFIFTPADTNTDSVYDSVPISSVNIGKRITTAPAVFSGSSLGVLVGDDAGNVSLVSFASLTKSTTNVSSFPVSSLIVDNVSTPNIWYAVSSNRIYRQSGEQFVFPTAFSGFSVGGSQMVVVIDTVGRSVRIFDTKLNLVKAFSIDGYGGPFSAPVMGDVNRDGKQELLFPAGNKILAFNQNGFLLDGFPVILPGSRVSSLVLLDMNGDDEIDIAAATDRGTVHVITSRGKIIHDYSLEAGEMVQTSPLVFPASGSIGFSVMDAGGYLHSWQFASPYGTANAMWQGAFGDIRHSNFAVNFSGVVQPLATAFFPKDRVYNWPNPVYGTTTQIRFYTSEDAVVNVKVYDLAGSKVADFSGRGFAGTDSEITWDVSNIQSGIYFARVEAVGASSSDFAVIKVAVVK